ncbi:hypothetical protein GGX14DRAFT_571292 [Mycena pura]|uniref:AMP-dependent synthetase/ligase domain-containing protein n=1 Tax=Mycena pura TaxID=153505 RepID=A0AAD6V3W2_9AGAR|nr:hypothetical protein GGX14DRAFT_571292 [Mycena pura]
MPEFHSSRRVSHIPDDVTLEQFILGYRHEARPTRPESAPWLVSAETGRQIRLDEIHRRTTGFANALHTHFGIRENDVVLIFSPNHIEYPICIWAVHRLCAIVSACNPTYSSAELTSHLLQTRATLIIAHSSLRDVARAGAHAAGVPSTRIIVLDNGDSAGEPGVAAADEDPDLGTVAGLTAYGLGLGSAPLGRGRRLREGEGHTKVAFLSSSSGATRKPKARPAAAIIAISHFAVIANVVQIATHCRVNEAYTSWVERRYRPGDTCLGVLPFYHVWGLTLVIHFVLFSGMTLIVAPTFHLESVLKTIVRHKINQLILLPPQVEPVVRDYDLSGVRSILCAAAPLGAETSERIMRLLPNAHIGQAYGATETAGIISMWPLRSQRGYNAGELVPGLVTRVVRSDGALAEHNEAGELLVRTPSLALGYLGDEDTRPGQDA